MQNIGATGDGKSSVATPDGKKPKEEEEVESAIKRNKYGNVPGLCFHSK